MIWSTQRYTERIHRWELDFHVDYLPRNIGKEGQAAAQFPHLKEKESASSAFNCHYPVQNRAKSPSLPLAMRPASFATLLTLLGILRRR
jgi:hypothetical protein